MRRYVAFLAVLFCLPPLVVGCSAAGPIAAAVATGAKWLAGVVDHAQKGADAYYARHPSMDAQPKVTDALAKVRAAGTALESGADAAKKKNALAALMALTTLLEDTGVLGARAPEGGAENSDAPEPEPFKMPSEAEASAELGLP